MAEPPYTARCRRKDCDAFLGRFATQHAADQARRHHVDRWHPIGPEAGAYYRPTTAGVPRWHSTLIPGVSEIRKHSKNDANTDVYLHKVKGSIVKDTPSLEFAAKLTPAEMKVISSAALR
jgi:hypothetical protein